MGRVRHERRGHAVCRGWWQRRAHEGGIAQTILSLGLFLLMLALWGCWTGYTRVEQTRTSIEQIVGHGLSSGLVTPVTAGGGYLSEPYGASGPPQVQIPGVVQYAAHVATNTVPQSQVTTTATSYTWTLSAADQTRWDLSGSVVVSQVAATIQSPYRLTATVTAPLRVSLWGVAVVPATLRLAVAIPIAGQQAPAQFQSY